MSVSIGFLGISSQGDACKAMLQTKQNWRVLIQCVNIATFPLQCVIASSGIMGMSIGVENGRDASGAG